MHKNSFYRTLNYRTLSFRSMALAAAVLAGSMTAGCQAEHNKFSADSKKEFEGAKLGILYQVAEQQYKVGDYDKCKEGLAQMLATKASFAPMHTLAAKVDLEGGSLDDAATQLRKSMEITPNDPEPYYLLGVVYQRWQQLDTAAGYYEQAAAKKPDEAMYVLAAAEMKISTGKLDEAREYLNDKIMYFDQSSAMRVALGRIATLQGKTADAVKDYRDATLLTPEDKNIRWSYASALFDDEKYSDCARILEDMRDDPPIHEEVSPTLAKGADAATDDQAKDSAKIGLLMMLGESYVNMKRPLDARQCFQDVIRVQPENVSAYLSLGKTCLMTGELNLTLAAAQKVLRNDPANVQAKILEAAVQQKQKKWSEAYDTLSPMAAATPQNETVLCMLGLSEIQLGKKEQAQSDLEKAVAVSPTDSWASELLAEVKPPAPASDEESRNEPHVVPLPAPVATGSGSPAADANSAVDPAAGSPRGDSVTNAAGSATPNDAAVQGQ